jgi:DNA-directed RNA polymerase subunit beta'
MALAKGTVGRLWLQRILPPDLYRDNMVLDKKGVSDLLKEVAGRYPDKYRDISFQLNQLGRESSYTTGGNSFGPESLTQAKVAIANRQVLQQQMDALLDDDNIDNDTRREKILSLVRAVASHEKDDIYDESDAEGNPLAQQLKGAGRGNRNNLASLRGSDWLYEDHRGRVIPVPITRSYSQGLTPLEYVASTYGARQGVLSTKFAVADAGFLSKQLNQITHRLIVTALDRDEDSPTLLGMPVDTDDDDNEGALLSAPAGGYKRNTVLTPKILRELKSRGINKLLVRSPAVGGAPDGGIYARDAGVRERGRLPELGRGVLGMTGAQSLGEPVSQGLLGAKHGGGVAGASKTNTGFESISQLIQVPKTFRGGAAHADLDGRVQAIVPADVGGYHVRINGAQHYVSSGYPLTVKVGDDVEAGDVISEGVPNPGAIVTHKGIGEGRRYFAKAYREAMRNAGLRANRRNTELLARGLINHVRLEQEAGDFVPDDIVPYSTMEHLYEPREGYKSLDPRQAVGRYLERPYLHYTIGDKVRPSMLKELNEFGVKTVDVHDKPPAFVPEMVRGMSNLQHDPDWISREFGSYIKTGLLDAVHRGGTSDETGTSFVPSLVKQVNFGKTGPLSQPKPPTMPEIPGPPKSKLKLQP